ncbi:MAG: ribonuclease HI family protein [Elusimicrobia bacterium]|nr:ribonuclease HI family protein [Elusimicrobiota bacterium]
MEALTAYVDGASRGNPGHAGIGVVLYSISDPPKKIKDIKKYIGKTTNNVAEYNAFLTALYEAEKLGAKKIKIFLDSELVFKQYLGEYKTKDDNLRELLKRVREQEKKFECIEVKHILRENNKEADKLANIAVNIGETS